MDFLITRLRIVFINIANRCPFNELQKVSVFFFYAYLDNSEKIF